MKALKYVLKSKTLTRFVMHLALKGSSTTVDKDSRELALLFMLNMSKSHCVVAVVAIFKLCVWCVCVCEFWGWGGSVTF